MNEKNKVCEFCEEHDATILCSECHRCYCDECNEFAHRNSLKKGHKVEVIPEGIWVDAMCPIHKKNPLEMFCIDELKLHCAMCKTEKLHKNHRTVMISEIDKESDKFSVAQVKERFRDVLKHDDELEKKIEDTIESIKNECESARSKITQTFVEAHEKLRIEEVKVIEEVEEACNEAEEALHKNLDNLRGIHEYTHALDEMDSLPLGQCSRLMELNIVSGIGKQKTAIEEMHKMMITDLKINWDSESRKLSFVKNLINGAFVPYNISFPVVMSKRVEIAWDYNEASIERDDKEELKYVVEVKKAGSDEWNEVYSGNVQRCNVRELDVGTVYDARVKCIIKGLQGEWSDVSRFRTRTLNIDSEILSQEENKAEMLEKLSEWSKMSDFDLLYRGTRDEFISSSFHRLCDDKGCTIVLIKNASGHVFGGFASIPWGSSKLWKKAPGTFIFTLTNMHGIEPTKFSLRDENDAKAICHYGIDANSWIFAFGSGIIVDSRCNLNMNSNSINFTKSFNDTTGKGNSIFSSSEESDYFKIQEIEVFSASV